jgi:hypothetical protein
MLRLDTYSRNIRAPRAYLVLWLAADARLYRQQGMHAEARYLLDLARAHAEIIIGAGC